MEIRMNKVKRMTQEEAEEYAVQIVHEAIAFNKVGIQLKNIWIGKILDHWILKENRQESLPVSERTYYNLYQHSKVMDVVRNLDTTNGIESLLDFISKVDDSPIIKPIVNKQEEFKKLSGDELRVEWKREFNAMTVQQKKAKCSAWLTCGCPRAAIPPFIIEYIKTLDDANKEEMSDAYKIGQDKAGYWSKSLVRSFPE